MTISHPIAFNKIPTLNQLEIAYPGLRALFFDMDGTLFNTEPHHELAFLEIGKQFQIRPPHSKEVVHELLVGKADHMVYEIVKSWENFPFTWSADDFIQAKNEHLLRILETSDPTTFFPRATRDLLIEAQAKGLFLALVTSSEKVITKRLLEIADVTHFFKLILTRDDCPQVKPDPWPYNHALQTSGLQKHEVVIFEDSNVGLAAASGSGAHVIKVEWHA